MCSFTRFSPLSQPGASAGVSAPIVSHGTIVSPLKETLNQIVGTAVPANPSEKDKAEFVTM